MQWCWLCFILLINYTWYKIFTEVSGCLLRVIWRILLYPQNRQSTVQFGYTHNGFRPLESKSYWHWANWITWWRHNWQHLILRGVYIRPSTYLRNLPPTLLLLPISAWLFRTCGARNTNIRVLLDYKYLQKCVHAHWIILIQHHPDHLKTCNISQAINYTKVPSLFFGLLA